jgi:hypothetical protein
MYLIIRRSYRNESSVCKLDDIDEDDDSDARDGPFPMLFVVMT